LINDLDLEVKDLSAGIIYKPWVLNASPHIDSLSQLPTRSRDSLNTAEQVSIQLPAAGNYELKVIGTSVSTTSLPFYIAYHIDTLNTFVFTSPQHTSDINRDENPDVYIRWKTFVADTNQTGNLWISYDNGTNWQLLKQSLKIYTNQYQWLVKDTNSTAVLRMETAFGNFFSKGVCNKQSAETFGWFPMHRFFRVVMEQTCICKCIQYLYINRQSLFKAYTDHHRYIYCNEAISLPRAGICCRACVKQ
jgi:hypothetical protein